ncbi:MAG: hypothetical protein JXA20_12835 [Spirochaetes bacterium]|nr:hypothetical protein [Spirochaetota bacterium]
METIIEMGVTVMENFSGLILAFVFVWISYCFWTGIYGAIIITGVLGWRKFKRQGFLLILLSGCIRLLHHLPSIYCKGVYAMRRLTPAEYGEAAMIWVYIDSIVVPIASLLLVIGLLFLVFKGPLEFADPDERGY